MVLVDVSYELVVLLVVISSGDQLRVVDPLRAQAGVTEYEVSHVDGAGIDRLMSRRRASLDGNGSDSVGTAKDLVQENIEITDLSIVDLTPERPILREEFTKEFQAVTHHREPDGMFKTIVVFLECLTGVEWRINVDQLDLARVVPLESLKCRQVVTANQEVRCVIPLSAFFATYLQDVNERSWFGGTKHLLKGRVWVAVLVIFVQKPAVLVWPGQLQPSPNASCSRRLQFNHGLRGWGHVGRSSDLTRWSIARAIGRLRADIGARGP